MLRVAWAALTRLTGWTASRCPAPRPALPCPPRSSERRPATHRAARARAWRRCLPRAAPWPVLARRAAAAAARATCPRPRTAPMWRASRAARGWGGRRPRRSAGWRVAPRRRLAPRKRAVPQRRAVPHRRAAPHRRAVPHKWAAPHKRRAAMAAAPGSAGARAAQRRAAEAREAWPVRWQSSHQRARRSCPLMRRQTRMPAPKRRAPEAAARSAAAAQRPGAAAASSLPAPSRSPFARATCAPPTP
mmetsp:Transcript_4247/g.11027  ORF Transcript_4247/g.11027 Transcript_4247/m.11027 type:complete len:246 (-) Transcript_4247:260-997(-)